MTRDGEGIDLVIVQFLVPKRDRQGGLYPRAVHQRLREDLEEQFGGWSSLGDKPLPGAWRNPESGEIEHDQSWRYEVGITPDLLEDLDEYLADLAHRLGQKAVWRVVYKEGAAQAIPACKKQGSRH